MTQGTTSKYLVLASHQPGTLSRILEFFVLRNIELNHLCVVQKGERSQEIRLETDLLSKHESTVVASKIAQIITVEYVECHTHLNEQDETTSTQQH